MPLHFGMVAPDRTAAVLENSIHDIRGRSNHVTVGDIGHRYLLQVLAEHGRSDVVFDVISQTTHPSYGYQVQHGATALTEMWDGPTRGLSQNHFMLGHVEEWFYRSLAGINPDPGAVGFQHILIKPQVVGDLTWVQSAYNSVRGRITSNWKIKDGQIHLSITIPDGCKATVELPTKEPQTVGSGAFHFSAPRYGF
jgi:hypothetical protein